MLPHYYAIRSFWRENAYNLHVERAKLQDRANYEFGSTGPTTRNSDTAAPQSRRLLEKAGLEERSHGRIDRFRCRKGPKRAHKYAEPPGELLEERGARKDMCRGVEYRGPGI